MEKKKEEVKLDQILELRFQEFGRRIASFDSIRDSISDLEEKFKELFSSDSSIKSIINSVQDNIFSCKKEIDRKIDLIQKSLSEIGVNESKFISCLKSLQNDLNQEGESNQKLNQKISEAKKSLDCIENNNANLSSSIDQLNKKHSILERNLSNAFSILDKQYLEISSCSSNIKIINGSLEQTQTNLSLYTQSLSQHISNIKQDIIEINKQLNLLSKKILADVEEKLSQIKTPDISNFVSKDHVDLLTTRLESAALDAKNANLKANHLEMQNQVLSKKLENVQLLLKQHGIQ